MPPFSTFNPMFVITYGGEYIRLDMPFPAKGFLYYQALEDASRFVSVGAAAEAITARNEAMRDLIAGPFGIAAVKVETTPARHTLEPRVVETSLGPTRLFSGVFELQETTDGRWFYSIFFNTTRPLRQYSPSDLRAIADLLERPSVTTTVPGSTTITLA